MTPMNPSSVGFALRVVIVLTWLAARPLSHAMNWQVLACPDPTGSLVKYTISKELGQLWVGGLEVTKVSYVAGTFTFLATLNDGHQYAHELNVTDGLIRMDSVETGRRLPLKRCTRVNESALGMPGPGFTLRP